MCRSVFGRLGGTAPRTTCTLRSLSVPTVLLLALFMWEGVRFHSGGAILLPALGLVLTLVAISIMPLQENSVSRARRVYTWFFLLSALLAYLDYEVMLAYGLSLWDRPQNDPSKYFEMAQVGLQFSKITDPGFVLFLETLWSTLCRLGEPTYLDLLNCVMVVSSLFAVCCVEIVHLSTPTSRILPYLFVFNPLVIALNASLLRDILIGAVGWSSVLCCIVFMKKGRRPGVNGLCMVAGFLVGVGAVFKMRTVSALFFAVVGIALGLGFGGKRRLNRDRAILITITVVLLGAAMAGSIMRRSASRAVVSDDVIETAEAEGSVGSHLQGGLSGRVAVAVGSTIVYSAPFWRIRSPGLALETAAAFGSLFAQIFTSLPILLGLVFLLKNPNRLGWTLLLIYVAFCIGAAIMLQMHGRYVVSHLLPVIAAIGASGWMVLKGKDAVRRITYHWSVFAVFLMLQFLIDIVRARM